MATDRGTRGYLLQREIEITNADSPYTVPSEGDTYLLVDSSSAAVVVNLPAISDSTDTNRVTIVDFKSSSGTNNITVNPDGSDTIEETTSAILNVNGTTLTFRANLSNTNWKII